MLLAVAFSALFLSSVVSAQTPMVVMVGATATAQGGIFQFIPNNFNATNGTVISFEFTGQPGNHTVTQSTFSDPCNPVAGGFDSGWVQILPTVTVTQTPTFNLTITNDQHPIWFFCKQLNPATHCNKGMVGAINAAATGNTFAAFQQKAMSSTTSGQGEGGLIGIDASASAQVGPIQSGIVTFLGAPLASSAAATATAPGTGANPTATAPGSATSPASSTTPMSSAALGLTACYLTSMLAAAFGFFMA